MQDRYTGDIGDFGKYGLLKALCGHDLSLGVIWYLVPDEDRPGDGSHIRYLDPTPNNLRKFEACDPALYRALGEIVRDGERKVRSIRERTVLPPGTVFYEEPLSFAGMPGIGPRATAERLEHRDRWVRGALEATWGCDVVFVDPDNGLKPGATRRHHKLGPKYVYFEELVPYVRRGQSLVIYHHLHYGATREIQVRERLSQINGRLNASFALLYRPGTGRAFFVVPSEAHQDTLFERAKRLANDPCWSRHFHLKN